MVYRSMASLILSSALFMAGSRLNAAELKNLPGPVSAHVLSVPAPDGFRPGVMFHYADQVEMTLLRLVQALTQGNLAASHPNPDLLAFFVEEQLDDLSRPAAFYASDAGLALRARWARFLAYRADFVYRTPLHEEAEAHGMDARWASMSSFFWRYFPGLRPSLDGDVDSQIAAICGYFGPDFACSPHHHATTAGGDIETLIIAIDFRGHPYLRWVLWEHIHDGAPGSAGTYLEDARPD